MKWTERSSKDIGAETVERIQSTSRIRSGVLGVGVASNAPTK
jgi:hypothetical protein